MNSSHKVGVVAQLSGGAYLSDKQISQTIYFIRCIAILSVITAHVSEIENSDLISNIITHIWAIIARFGVPAFLITGGYYYRREKHDSKVFWNKKLFSVIIPWIIASIITYSLSAFSHKDFSIFNYLKWFVGSKTLYYYMTIYIVMLVIFKFCKKTSHLVMFIFITFGSLLLEQLNIYNDYGNTIMTGYLNPLNWIGYFAFGIIIKRYHFEKKSDVVATVTAFIIFITFSILEIYYDELSYFSIFNPITQTSLLAFLWGLLKQVKIKHNLQKIILFIGGNTLIIYFYHIQIVQFVSRHLPTIWIVHLFKPFLGLFIMVIVVYVEYVFFRHIPFGENIMKLIGLKEPRTGDRYGNS